PTDLCTLSLHDALPISSFGGHLQSVMVYCMQVPGDVPTPGRPGTASTRRVRRTGHLTLTRMATETMSRMTEAMDARAAALRERIDRKSTRLNSSHVKIS